MNERDEQRIAAALEDLASTYDARDVAWSSVAAQAGRRQRTVAQSRRTRVAAGAAAALVLVLLVGTIVVRWDGDATLLTQSSGTAPHQPPGTVGTPAASLPPIPAPGRRCTVPGIDLVNRKSESSPLADASAAETERVARSQAELWGDLAIIRLYGAQHPDEWVGVQYEYDQPERIQAVFTDRIDVHRGALATKVSHPDRLDVRQGCYSKATIDAVRGEVEARLPPGSWRRLSDDLSGVEVDLNAAGVELAADLWAHHGDILWITVGGRPYPPDATTSARAGDNCTEWELPPSADETTIEGLALSLAVATPTVVSGADIDAELVAHNTSGARIDLGYRGLIVQMALVRRGTRDVVGHRVPGYRAGVGEGGGPALSPEPGATQRVRAEGGTASCDFALGYSVPPGEYDLLAAIPVYEPRNDWAGNPNPGSTPPRAPTRYVITPPAPVTIR